MFAGGGSVGEVDLGIGVLEVDLDGPAMSMPKRLASAGPCGREAGIGPLLGWLWPGVPVLEIGVCAVATSDAALAAMFGGMSVD